MVSKLLRDGIFAAQDKIDAAPDNEVRELAEKLWYLRQDFSDSAREQNLLPTISQHFFGKGFPDDTKEIAELLKTPVHRQQIMRELAVFADEHEKSPDLLRFRHHPVPRDLLEQVAGLFTPREQFQSVEDFAPAKASFITEDEITRLLAGGPNISESKLQIYSYFVQGHNAKECAQFLKESYGEGGYGRQGYNENHGTKGISLTREDEESGYKGYDTVTLMYSDSSGEWRVQNKSADSRDNVRVHTTYGTKRINAYEIFEAALNQRDVRVFDTKWVDGQETRVLNEKETAIAQQKQEAICEKFKEWIFKDPERREVLCRKYNDKFNNIRPREYDGSHINFAGMTPEITLRPHQRNAVAHILYGKNTLLAQWCIFWTMNATLAPTSWASGK